MDSMLYSCSAVVDKDVEDFPLVPTNYVLSRFVPIVELGTGSEGITFKVLDIDTNKVSAMKSRILEYDSFQEIKIGCMLAPTRMYTHSIIMPELWGITDRLVFLDGSNPILSNWLNNQEVQTVLEGFADKSEIRSLIFTMPLLDATLDSIYSELTHIEKLSIFFELVIALISLRRINIIHNDLHGGNILIKKTDECRSYTINNTSYIITSEYMPVIIDFGIATNFKNQRHYAADWSLTHKRFIDVLPVSLIPEIKKANGKILLDPIFDYFKTDQMIPGVLVRLFASITI